MIMLNCAQSGDDMARQIDLFGAGGKGADKGEASGKFDLRTYGMGAQILRDLGVSRMRVLSAPRRMPSMTGFGLEVTGFHEG